MDLWFWVRPGRGKNMIFLTTGGKKPYITNARNLRKLQGSTQNLPSLMAKCIKVAHDKDKGRYTVLESNGTVWTVQNLLPTTVTIAPTPSAAKPKTTEAGQTLEKEE